VTGKRHPDETCIKVLAIFTLAEPSRQLYALAAEERPAMESMRFES